MVDPEGPDFDIDDPEELFGRLYESLRSLAGRELGRERPDHTLQPTALGHEAGMRLVAPDGTTPSFADREHVLRTVARTMRRILVDHARAKRSEKRGDGRARSAGELDRIADAFREQGSDGVELDDALAALADTDEELARIVELRTFGGLTMDETARAVGMSKATAERRWAVAKMWLSRALGAP